MHQVRASVLRGSSAAGSVLAALGLTTVTAGAQAAEYLRPRSSSVAPGSAIDRARNALEREADSFGIRGLELVEPHALRIGSHTTVRLTQRYRGVPVLGRSVAVHLDADGRVELLMLDVARRLALDVHPVVSGAGALGAIRSRGAASVGLREPMLAVLADAGNAGTLVWVVDAPSADGGRRFVVDARSGVLLSDRPLAMRASGRVYPISQVVTPQVEDRELVELAPAAPARLTGWDGQLVVTNFVAYGAQPGIVFLDQSVGPSSGDDFLYDPPADPSDSHDAFAQVNAYYQLSRARAFFGSTFGLDMSGPAWKLVAATNVLDQGAPFDGAYYSPAGVSAPWDSPNFLGAGQGSSIDFAYDSDVFLHEFTHYVNYNAVRFNAGQFALDDWGWSPFSIAIDEGVADYFACTMNDGPVVGEATLAPMGKERDLSDVSKRCPDDVVGEGHLDGEIIGSFAWSLREAFGREAADQLVWGAVTLLPYGASFGDFVQGVRQLADDLVQDGSLAPSDLQALEQLLRQRGLDNCGREVSIPMGEARTMLLFGLDAVALGYDTTCEQLKTIDGSIPGIFHFVATPPASSTGLRFTIELTPGAPGALEWSAYVRAGQHVTFGPGDPMPVVTAYDRALTGVTASTAEVLIDATSEPPFDPTTTYHLALTHRNCPGVTAKVSVEDLGGEPEPEADAGDLVDVAVEPGEGGEAAAPGTSEAAGCGCRLAGTADSGDGRSLLGWAVALVVALGACGVRGRRVPRS